MSLPSFWREIDEKYNMVGTVCKTCKTFYFPGRELCPKCRRKGKIEEAAFKGEGKIYSYTKIHVPHPDFKASAPYFIAIIELEEGPRILAQLVDIKTPSIGMRVRAVVRKIKEDGKNGIIHYGYKFEEEKK